MRHFCCSDPTGPGQVTPQTPHLQICSAQSLLQLQGWVKGLQRAQINRRWGGASGIEGGSQAHSARLAGHLLRSAHPSQVPKKKIIWEIAQLIFKLLQKQLLKISSTKIKTLLSQKPPALQAAASKTQSTNSTGGHKSQRNL